MKTLLEEKETCEQVYCEKISRPDWVTDELLLETRRVWQKFYETPLTEPELVKMIVDAGWLLSVDN